MKRKKTALRLKLKYLREIDKNLMLHATQPKEMVFGRYSAPPIVLRRIIVTLEDLTKCYKEALAMQLRVVKVAELGTVEHALAMLQEWSRRAGSQGRRVSKKKRRA